MNIVIDSPTGIQLYHLTAQLHACELQLKGFTFTGRRSIIAHVKRENGLKGNNESVVHQFRQIVESKREAYITAAHAIAAL